MEPMMQLAGPGDAKELVGDVIQKVHPPSLFMSFTITQTASRSLLSLRKSLWMLIQVHLSCFLLSFSYILIHFLGRSSILTSRTLLPYLMVSGLTIHSRSFIKAISLIAKQSEASNCVSTKILNVPNAPSSSKRKKKIHGAFSVSHYFIV